MVVQQIDLVDIEQAPVGFGQQARFKGTNAITERLLDVNGSAQSVFRGPSGRSTIGTWRCSVPRVSPCSRR